jgi:hypothetical protein
VTALGSGSAVGVLILVSQSLLTNVATVFPNASTSTIATMFQTLVLDLLRRQPQGPTPVKIPVAATGAAPSTSHLAPAEIVPGDSIIGPCNPVIRPGDLVLAHPEALEIANCDRPSCVTSSTTIDNKSAAMNFGRES